MTLGEYIKNYRQQHHIGQDTFAKLSGLSKGYVATLELNKNTTSGNPPKPTLDIYYKIAHATGISPCDLIKSLDGDVVINSPYTFEEQMIIYAFRMATDKDKNTVHSVLDSYLESEKDTASSENSSMVTAG